MNLIFTLKECSEWMTKREWEMKGNSFSVPNGTQKERENVKKGKEFESVLGNADFKNNLKMLF